MRQIIIIWGLACFVTGILVACGIFDSELDLSAANITGAILVGSGLITCAIGLRD